MKSGPDYHSAHMLCHKAFVSAVEEVVDLVDCVHGFGRTYLFSQASRDTRPKDGYTSKAGLAQWSRFTKSAIESLNDGYVSRLCSSFQSYNWGRSEHEKVAKLENIVFLYKKFISSRAMLISSSSALDPDFENKLRFLKGFGGRRFDYVDIANDLRGILDTFRCKGSHIQTYCNAINAVRTINDDLRLALKAEIITDLCAYLLLPAAYGFFQSDNIQGQSIVRAELDRIIGKGVPTPYSAFVRHTILYQLRTSSVRSKQMFKPSSPFLTFKEPSNDAANALEAYDLAFAPSGNGIVSCFRRDFGAKCNAGLEAVFLKNSVCAGVHYANKSAEQLLISDIQAAIGVNDEQAARVQLTLAETYLNDMSASLKSKEKALCKAFDMFSTLNDNIALVAKGTLLLARLNAQTQFGNGLALVLAEQAASLYSRFGADIRAHEANMFRDFWAQKKRP